MIAYIIGGTLAATGIITLIFGCKKIKVNKNIEKINNILKEENEKLKQEHIVLNQKSEQIYNEIQFLENLKQQKIKEQEKAAENYFDILDLTYEAKENEFDVKIAYLKALEEQKLKENKKDATDAFVYYIDELCKEYTKAEKDFDTKINILKEEFSEYSKELEKIQKTYAAAIEAQLREAEIQQSLDFFCLHLTPAEQSTIALIEELKPRLPEPRVLSMLVWQTFYQKKMNGLCLSVLKKSTPICGIYKITNRKTGLCYIGQSVDISKRWKDHAKCGLGIDTPVQNKLYQAMLKDGLTNFTFELLEECDRNLLNEKEKFYINLYQACDYGYNSTQGNK